MITSAQFSIQIRHNSFFFPLCPSCGDTIRKVKQRHGFSANSGDLASHQCLTKTVLHRLFLLVPALTRVTCNSTLLLEADVDFIARVCGSSATSSPCHMDTRTCLHDVHTCPLQSNTAELNSYQQCFITWWAEGGWEEGLPEKTSMHNLSKSHQKAYLFTDLLNKEKNNI